MTEERLRGRVVWFNSKTGIGFVSNNDGSGDVFVHYSNIISEGFKTLKAGQEVEFEFGTNHKGRQACAVQVVDDLE